MSTMEKSDKTTHTSKKKNAVKSLLSSSNKMLIVYLVVALIACIMFSPVFNIKKITIVGNNSVSEDTIKSLSGIKHNENILKTDLNTAASLIKRNPYINTVEISRKFPGTVEINVTECKKCAYIVFANSALAIDKNIKLLEIIPLDKATDLPLIYGVTPQNTAIAAKISCGDPSKSEALAKLTSGLSKSNISDKIATISFDENSNISMILRNNIKVLLGNGETEYKLACLQAAYPESLSHKTDGTFDITNPNKPILIG